MEDAVADIMSTYCDDTDEVLRQINMLIEPNIPAGPAVIHQKAKDRGLW